MCELYKSYELNTMVIINQSNGIVIKNASTIAGYT